MHLNDVVSVRISVKFTRNLPSRIEILKHWTTFTASHITYWNAACVNEVTD